MSIEDRLRGIEEKRDRYVRTPEGAEKYGQPIGSRIVRDAPRIPKWQQRRLEADRIAKEPAKYGPLTQTQYEHLMLRWETPTGARELKQQMREYLKGFTPGSDYSWPAEASSPGPFQPREPLGFNLPEFKRMVDESPSKRLFRGMRLSTVKFNQMVRNGVFDEPMGSATTNEELGVEFSAGFYSGRLPREKGVLFILEDAPAHKIDEDVLTHAVWGAMNTGGRSQEQFAEDIRGYDEHLTTGRFKITKIEDDYALVQNWYGIEEVPYKRIHAVYQGPLVPGEQKAANVFTYNEDFDVDEGDEPTTSAYLNHRTLEPDTQEGKSMEEKGGVRHVRTAAGVAKYGQPLGSVIIKDVFRGIKLKGKPDGKGTVDDPIDVGKDLDLAVRIIANGGHVRLHQPDEVTIVLDKLVARVKAAEKRGSKAPNYNLCLISIPNTNLFCAGNKGIERIRMPQLSGIPIPGSPAEKLPQRGHGTGEVMGEKAFRAALEASGIKVTDGRKKASHLRSTQNELIGPKVAGIAAAMRAGSNPQLDAPIFVTRDNYIVDGHHRWAARVAVDADDGVLGDEEMDVEIIDADIGAVIDFANAFSTMIGIQQAGFTQTIQQAKAIVERLQTKVVEEMTEPDPRVTIDSEFLKEAFAELPETEDIEEVEMKWLFDSIPVFLMDMECDETKVGPQSPDPRAARLRRYWSTGVGGVSKIKWGVPGDGKRCIRHLSKYLGPRAAGYCQNLHQQMVGSRVMGQGPGEKSAEEELDEMFDGYDEFYEGDSGEEKSFELQSVETKKKFSAERREELAKEGEALPGGSYPIENEQDLRNAIHAYGRSKPEDRAKVRAHIIKRARALGLSNLIPEGWTDEKGLWIDLESKEIREALDGDIPEVAPEEKAPEDSSLVDVVKRVQRLNKR